MDTLLDNSGERRLDKSAGPLEGIRVLDLTSVLLGPLCTQILADYGADVIKIETPNGDRMRSNGGHASKATEHEAFSSIFLAVNRNKRSVVLDLKTEAGPCALHSLIPTADVFIHNMRVSAVEKLGIGYEAVARVNPEIVYCAAPGFGQKGPHRDKPAFDDIIQAGCGLVGLSTVGKSNPDYVPSLIADKTTGLALANATMAALLHRFRRGRGQYVEVPMLETMAAFVLAEHMGGMTFPSSAAKAGYARLLEGGRKPLRTRDGWMSLLPYTGRHWEAFFKAVGREDLCQHYNLDDRLERNANIHALYGHLRDLASARTTAAWLELCARLDIPATPIFGIDELPEHPHLKAVGLFQQNVHPVVGPILEIRPTALFSETPTSIRTPAPALGEHTAEVLLEVGLSPYQVARLIPERLIDIPEPIVEKRSA
jgi:crotonobetainyl-CoA:carnitine CoA-transferase CaiB-like acyl-CoA transferase